MNHFSRVLLFTAFGELSSLAADAPSLKEAVQKVADADARHRPTEVLTLGRELLPKLEAANLLDDAETVALMVAFASDKKESHAEAITTAETAKRLVTEARWGRMRPWDWTLQAQLTGIVVKHRVAEGRLSLAQTMQAEAWRLITESVRLECGQPWQVGRPLPQGINQTSLGIIARNTRYDLVLLGYVGRTVEGVARVRQLDEQWQQAHHPESLYRVQMLNELSSNLNFLCYDRQAFAVLDSILHNAKADASQRLTARFNKAFWSAQLLGPQPEFLEEARRAMAEQSALVGMTNLDPTKKRVLAKMALLYRDAGVKIGDLEALIDESLELGDRIEAISARRDMASMQVIKGDFATAEKNLLQVLAELREIGRKSGEPPVYQSYGDLLVQVGRPQEGVTVLREAARMTRSFGWIQRLPGVLFSLASAQRSAGDAHGLRATLHELDSLLARGDLEPLAKLKARLACALCLQALGESAKAAAMLAQAIATGSADGLSDWQLAGAKNWKLGEESPVAATAPALADLQPVQVTCAKLTGEPALARFTLSNPSATVAAGMIVISGGALTAEWGGQGGNASLHLAATGAPTELRHPVRLESGSEWMLTADAAAEATGQVSVLWQPVVGEPQTARWIVQQDQPDGAEVAVTNASLAGRNAFYALRLHHTLARRGGDAQSPVDLRVKASHPLRIEILNEAYQFIAVDANGDGDFEDPGDMVASDADADGFPDVTCASGKHAEITLLVFPATTAPAPGSITLDLSIKDATGWQVSSQDVLK